MRLQLYAFLLLGSMGMALAADAQVKLPIKVNGKVLDKDGKEPLRQIVIVNKRTGTGTFADPDGSFTVTIVQSDTLQFTATGFMLKSVCFKDSVYKKEYNVSIKLQKLYYVLKEVDVFPVKKLEEIQKDIDKIGVKKTNTYKDVNAFSSPITALYERFSKLEQSKRWVAQKENEELKRGVLKDLFRIYIKYDIINLSDDEFEEFINYCYFRLSEDFIKNATEFELVMAIKEKYEKFASIKKAARTQF